MRVRATECIDQARNDLLWFRGMEGLLTSAALLSNENNIGTVAGN